MGAVWRHRYMEPSCTETLWESFWHVVPSIYFHYYGDSMVNFKIIITQQRRLCEKLWHTLYADRYNHNFHVICNTKRGSTKSGLSVAVLALACQTTVTKFRTTGFAVSSLVFLRWPIVWTGNFSLLHRVLTSSGAHLASCPMGTGVCFPGGKTGGREADYSPPSVEVKNAWRCASAPQCLHGVVLS
jgi:hypothetical protein